MFMAEKCECESKKRNKIFRKRNSHLRFSNINDIIYVLGGMNYGKSYRENREHYNREF